MIETLLNIAGAYLALGFGFAVIALGVISPGGDNHGFPRWLPGWIGVFACVALFWLPMICSKDGTVTIYRRKLTDAERKQAETDERQIRDPWGKP